jgi:hypothetical protein
MKTFPINGSIELTHFELGIRLKQCELLQEAGFTHIREEDIPLSSDDYDISEYISLIIDKMSEKLAT